jgi:hypothetical protein
MLFTTTFLWYQKGTGHVCPILLAQYVWRVFTMEGFMAEVVRA